LRRNFLLKHVIEAKVEAMKRRVRRRKELLADLKEKKRYWNFKEEALDRTLGNSVWKRLETSRKTDYAMNSIGRPTTASKFVEKVRLLLGQYYHLHSTKLSFKYSSQFIACIFSDSTLVVKRLGPTGLGCSKLHRNTGTFKTIKFHSWRIPNFAH
jgi:hypothetical protein